MPYYLQGQQPAKTTILEAVNVLLTNIGEQPVDNLDNEQILDARIAEETLVEFAKEGQQRGWSWNTEFAYPFQKDETTKEINVPENVVRFSPDPYCYGRRYIQRGQRVYDQLNRTYKFDDTVTEIQADVVWFLSWNECPEAFNRWTTIRAARVFSDRTMTNEALFKYTSKDEEDAKAELDRIEHEIERPNMLTDGAGLSPFPTYIPATGLANRRAGSYWRV